MSRVREFDTDEVIQKAMEVFWTHGYEGTSIQDLAEATGLGRGSLYAAFGSKHGLYELALQRYVLQTTDATRRALMRREPIRKVMRDLLLGRLNSSLEVPGRPGCLLVMAITERVPHDEATNRIVRDAIGALQDSFSATLYMARSMGELPVETDVPTLANFLVTMIQGLRIMSAVSTDLSTLEQVIDVALVAIPE
ncbi:TetR/AcrR family transcriptional regulator, transcriptional repressor for nem operon [Amycolatopsis xylanica]|uniref:TetR/AcrR family transcriptional regulator, transcriptional repressor for nem operon n=1 Tax=Amycolatopsis xylanica TaxID=589385 RepID=A0A1H2UWD1_9PSEU|nr:TetR/AcrR family transcriptional regulator [Amycolatopsis xylanica]SDW60382.1 TetR/AcrR family transcriptional regulator, transcriptional repressor for nem operon [Amycolatopsis xylanica]